MSSKVYFAQTNMNTMSCGDSACEFKANGTYKACMRIINMHMKLKHPHITTNIVLKHSPPPMRKTASEGRVVRANLFKYNQEQFEASRAKANAVKELFA